MNWIKVSEYREDSPSTWVLHDFWINLDHPDRLTADYHAGIGDTVTFVTLADGVHFVEETPEEFFLKGK